MEHDILTLEGVKIDHVIEDFIDKFQPSGKLIVANGIIHIYIMEDFYFRIGSEVATTVIFEQKEPNLLVVHIAVAGGRDMLGVSLRSQKSMLKKLRNFFVKLNE